MARPATSTSRLLAGSREPCRVATTTNIDPAAGGLLTIDGITVEVGDRVLVKDQSDQRQNGIYGASAGEWYRASDARSPRAIDKGVTVHVQEGTANGGKVYAFQTLDPVLGTDGIQIGFYISDDIVADAEADLQAAADAALEAADVANAAAAEATAAGAAAVAAVEAEGIEQVALVEAAGEAAGAAISGIVSPLIIAENTFGTKGSVELWDPSAGPAGVPPDYVRTAGHFTSGDGGGALYKKVASEPAHAGKIQSADGTWWEIAENILNVRQFGARGDDVIEDTTAFQDALACAAGLTPYGAVYIPSGRYVIDGITIPAGVSMFGHSMSGSRLHYKGTGTAITWESTKDLPTGEALPHTGSYLRDFSLWQSIGTKVGTGIWWKHATRSHLIRVGIKNFDIGIDTSGASWSSSIDQCWIVLNAYGIWISGTDANYVRPDQPGYTTMSFSGFNGGLIQRNEIQGNDVGIYMPFETTVGASVFMAHGLKIFANVIEGQQKNGIVWSQHQGGLVVEKNYFELNCQTSSIDITGAALALADNVVEYNAVVCQNLPTTNRQMTKPVFRDNHFVSHAANVWAFYHDRGAGQATIHYDGNHGSINGLRVEQRNADFAGYGFVGIGNAFNTYSINASQLSYCTLIGNNIAGSIVGDNFGNTRSLRVRGILGLDYTLIATDADATLTPGTTGHNVRHNGTLTANRTLTLDTAAAVEGTWFKVTRTGAGAFTLSVGGLKSLSDEQWCEVVYNGTAWYLAAYGTL